MSVAMRCHFTSTHFHLLRVAGGSGGKERTDETIFLRGARLCLWTAHPEPAQAGLSDHLGISPRAVGEWEAGSSYPKATHLKALIALAVKEQVFPVGHEEEEIRALWKAAHQKVLLDETWLSVLLSEPPAPSAQVSVEQSGGAQVGSTPTPSQTSLLVLWSLSLAWACLAACKQGARA